MRAFIGFINILFMSNYFQPQLSGGLCNKLFCLFSACDIAIKNNTCIIDPIFGWSKKILFSDIYDIDYFNESMKPYFNGFNGSSILIKNEDVQPNSQIIRLDWLWEYSENVLKKQREDGLMNKDCMNIAVLKALRLNKKYKYIIDIFGKQEIGMHIRIEKDWVKYYKENTSFFKDESVLIDVSQLIVMYKESSLFLENNSIFFSCGESQESIINTFKESNIISHYYYNKDYEYEINAAINFEILVNAKAFIGLSRSTFSNLISCKRSLIGNDNSYIYNYNNKLIRRIDKGLHPYPDICITKKTNII